MLDEKKKTENRDQKTDEWWLMLDARFLIPDTGYSALSTQH
jgi:hypothetical protein